MYKREERKEDFPVFILCLSSVKTLENIKLFFHTKQQP